MTTRLRFLADVNPPTPEFDRLPEDAAITFVPLEAVWPGSRWDATRLRPKSEVLSGYTRFREGDILVPKITPTFEADRTLVAHGLSGGVAAGTTELHIVRPPNGVDPRFLRYVFSSRPFLLGGEANMIGVAGQKRVPEAWLLDFPVVVTNGGEQRCIADFLDAETARIDALIEKKRRMSALLDEKWSAELSMALNARDGVRLKRLLAAPLAYGVLVPAHDANGIPMLRITDLRTGDVDLGTVARIPEALSAEYRRTIVSTGDLVVSVVGTLGRSVEVTTELAGCNLNRALARVQLQPGVPRSLVRFWFQSTQFQEQAHMATSGDSAQPTLGLGDMKNFTVGIPSDRSLWQEIAAKLEDREAELTQAKGVLRHQIALLVEHRQALITAAVTGELHLGAAA